jgi:hypothetical protein
VVLEYLGPSDEWVCPLILASSGVTPAELERRLPELAQLMPPAMLSRCMTHAPARDVLAVARRLRGLLAGFKSSPFAARALRATVIEAGGAATQQGLSAQESARSLDLVERSCVPTTCADIGDHLRELRLRLSRVAGWQTSPRASAAAASDCGVPAPTIDETVQRRIVYDLTQVAPTWSVRALLHSSSPGGQLLELLNEGLRVTVLVSYMATRDDAARHLQCRLMMIAVPRFRPVAGIGDEAFVVSSHHLLIRIGRLVLDVEASDQSFEAEVAVATRVLSSIRGPDEGGAVRSVPRVGARVRLLSAQLGVGWRVGLFNHTRQVPPCYHVMLADPGPDRRFLFIVPARAINRLQVSRLYPGDRATPDWGAAAFDDETWTEVALDSIVATGLQCADSVERLRR